MMKMRRLPMLAGLLMAGFLAGCDAWNVNPQPFPVWTAIPSRTPGVVTATPNIVIPTMTASPTGTAITNPAPSLETIEPSFTPEATSTEMLTPTPVKSVEVEILGCMTWIDITHDLGEVTNAYVTLKNTGSMDLPRACALLRASDTESEDPDRIKCVNNLPAGYQVTLKLTADTKYQVETVIQVDASSEDVLLLRADKPACTEMGVPGIPQDIGEIKPIPEP